MVRQTHEDRARAAEERARAQDEWMRQVLEDRALELARMEVPAAWGAAVEVVTFRLGRESYAIEARYLQAISRLQSLSAIPGASPPIFGVTAWRGQVLTIMDLHQILGVPRSGLGDLSRLLVLGEDRAAFGVLADEVDDLINLPLSAIHPLPRGVAGQREFLLGITGQALLVLDVVQLLQSLG